jgi:hypothetical protein
VKKQKREWAYLHLMCGSPAEFNEKEGRLFFVSRQINRLADSIQQVRREQRASMRYYKDHAKEYSFIRIDRAALRR